MILKPSNYCSFSGPKPSEQPILIPSWDPPQASKDWSCCQESGLGEGTSWGIWRGGEPTPGAQPPQQSSGGRMADMVSHKVRSRASLWEQVCPTLIITVSHGWGSIEHSGGLLPGLGCCREHCYPDQGGRRHGEESLLGVVIVAAVGRSAGS